MIGLVVLLSRFPDRTPKSAMLFLNFFRQNLYFIIGALLGLLSSLIVIPILESNSDCLGDILSDQYKMSKVSSNNIDEYEPQINLAGKPLKAQKVPQSFVRPRYFSTELGIREKLLMGVLSDSTSIETNSIAMNKTIAHLVEKIIYFVDTPNKLNISRLNMPDIVAFIDSRHILKPFHIFKYLIDNYLQEFDYFFLVNDSTFVNFRKLYKLVSKISVRETVYMGQRLNKTSPYCSLDAGILLSNSVLKALANSMDWCIKNIDSDSNDVNIGSCILHATSERCSSHIMGQSYASLNILQNTNVKYELQYLKKQADFQRAITVYPIIKENYFYILHSYFTRKGLEHDQAQIKMLREAIDVMSNKFPELKQNLTWPIGNQPGNKPNTRFDVLYWKYFTNTTLYLRDDFTMVSKHTPAELKDIRIVLENVVAFVNSKYSGKLKFVQMANGYKRFDISRGMDYIFDLDLRDTETNKLVQKRIQVCKPLGKIDTLRVRYVTENSRINLVVPVSHEDVNMTLKYMAQYRKVCMEKKEKTFLMLVLLYEPHLPGKDSKHDIYKQIKEKALSLTKDFKRENNKITWLSIKLPKHFKQYSYLHDHLLNFAILDLALKKFSADMLVFFTNPYTEFYNDFLNRIRMNTISGYQVFNPIPFNEYNPSLTQGQSNTIDINKSSGHFNVFNSDHISFYVKDYFKARERITLIPQVRQDKDILNLTQSLDVFQNSTKELVLNNIFAMFQSSHDSMVLLKATEPGLRIYYKPLKCDEQHAGDDVLQDQLRKHCLFLKNYNFGSRSQLAKAIQQYYLLKVRFE